MKIEDLKTEKNYQVVWFTKWLYERKKIMGNYQN